MVAIVNIAGQQFKVEAGQKVYVHRLAADKGDKVNFDQVLLLSTDSGATIGTPTVSGARIEATVLDHVQGDKVIVYKRKREKATRRKRSSPSFFAN